MRSRNFSLMRRALRQPQQQRWAEASPRHLPSCCPPSASGRRNLPVCPSARSFSTGPGRLQIASTSSPKVTLGEQISAETYHGWLPSRTHGAGQLRPTHDGQTVVLAGWILPGRKTSSTLSFHPLRDATGTVQLVLRTASPALNQALLSVPSESVVHVQGVVRCRPADQVKSTSSTGEVEVEVTEWNLMNSVHGKLPFQPSEEYNLPGEEVRAKHRYLDLRRTSLTENIRLRSRVAHRIRCFLHDQGFTEIETPLLLRSTPEGAREFLVPTRVPASTSPSFYALPQSPQQPKQLLMASGVTDKYFQVAKCFRDEDSRKDRQPEFTQIDLEMAFVDGAPPPASSTSAAGQTWELGGEQVRRTIEGLIRQVWLEAKGVDLMERRSPDAGEGPSGFPVMTYNDAMRRFGSDKPDVRFGLEMVDLQKFVKKSGLDHDGSDEPRPRETIEVVALRIPKPNVHGSQASQAQSSAAGISNKEFSELMKDKSGAAGKLERFKCTTPSPHVLAGLLLRKSGHMRKYLDAMSLPATEVDVESLAAGVAEALSRASFDKDGAEAELSEETHLFVGRRRDPPVGGSTELGELRLRIRDLLLKKGLATLPSTPHFLWITEFPLLTRSDPDKSELSAGRWSATHHPFTAPMLSDLPLLLDILSRLSSCASRSEQRALLASSSSEEEAASIDDSEDLPTALERIRGQHYDLVLDGVEVGGGSVRIHSAALQEALLSLVLQLEPHEVARFDHLLGALRSGCPPHAGIALGFDRLVSLLASSSSGAGAGTVGSIRDVIAFPKMSSGKDLLFGSPAPITPVEGAERSSTSSESREEEERIVSEWGLRLPRRAGDDAGAAKAESVSPEK